MKITLPLSLAVCTLFTGCLPPPPEVVVRPAYYHRPHPYYRPDVVVERGPVYREEIVVSPHCPAPRVEVRGRAPYADAVWRPGHWVRKSNGWVWIPGHWSHRY